MRRFLTVLILAIMVGGVVSAAGKGSRAGSHPHRYLPNSLDGAIAQVENTVDGHVWSAWSYRNGGEYDLALSVSTAPGVWSEPLLIGLDDGLDQLQPVMAIDSRGATYVAYADGPGAIRLTALQPGGNRWSFPVIVGLGEGPLSAPSLMLVGDFLIVGYRDGDDVALHAVPLLEPEYDQVRSIYDGPDPTNGFGESDGNEDGEASSTEQPVLEIGAGEGVTPTPVNTRYDGGD